MFKFIALAMTLSGFATMSHATDSKIKDAVDRVNDSCRIGKRAIKSMVKNAKKPTYIEGENQKLQSFVLDNGTVVVIDLNDCDNPKTFNFRGDKVVDARAASGQIYYRSSKGKIYVLTPNEEEATNNFSIYEIGTKSKKKYKRKRFYSFKRTSEGKQGILAWSSPECTQDEVEKSTKSRLVECYNENASLIIRGKAQESGRGLFRVNKYSPRTSSDEVEEEVRQTRKPKDSIVYFVYQPIKPKECVTVTREAMFLFIFSIETSVTYCE